MSVTTIVRVGRAAYRGFKAVMLKIAWAVAILILFFVYFVPLGLTSLICFLTRRDFLRIRTRNAETFWIERPPADTDVAHAERQF